MTQAELDIGNNFQNDVIWPRMLSAYAQKPLGNKGFGGRSSGQANMYFVRVCDIRIVT